METLHGEISNRMQKLHLDIVEIPGLEAVERELYNSLADSKGTVREMCSHILNAGGKRLRPLLVLYSGMIFAPTSELLLKAASAAELIHMATLVHDDIIDRAALRRGKPSINKLWGNHFAVLCGDYLFAKAMSILAGSGLIRSLDYMLEAIENMCCGEIQQASGKYDYNIDVDTYYDRISQKTAVFLECCCKSGASAAGAGEEHVNALGEFGRNLGLAFQITDDLLDLCGSSQTMGKPQNEDLKEGILTLPTILLLENESYRDWLIAAINGREFTEQFNNELLAVLKETGIIAKSYEIAAAHIEKAKACLKLLPQTVFTMALEEMADMVQCRLH